MVPLLHETYIRIKHQPITGLRSITGYDIHVTSSNMIEGRYDDHNVSPTRK